MLVDRFFVWVAEASVEQRLRAVDALVRAYFSPTSPADEREAIEAALTLVAEDAEIEVRRRLALALCDVDDAPRHLLLGLIWDHPSVAAIVVARSECLIDAELVDLAAGSTPPVQRAVAGRRRVGPTVATALAEAAERPAAVTLLANPGADIPAAALERLVERFGEFADVREALMARPHVPITVRHRVLEKLAEAMGNLVVVREWMRGERAETVTRDARDKATVALAAGAGTGETEVLVEHLRRTGQLTTRLLLRAACVGNLRFVEESLAALAGVPSARVSALVADGREPAFRALYRRASMPERAYPAFSAAIEIQRELLRETGGLDGFAGDRARFARRLVERVLTRYTAFDRRDGDDLVALLRRFAADAARDHVRGIVAERTAEAARTLALPRPDAVETPASEVEIEDLIVTAPSPVTEVAPTVDVASTTTAAFDYGRLDVVPESPLRFTFTPPRLVETPAAPAPAPAPVVEAADDYDEPIGLFSHVRLEDVPADWLAEEAAPVALWSEAGEGDGLFRASIDPQGAETVTETSTEAAPVDTAFLADLESAIGAELFGGLRGSLGTDRAA